MPQNAFTLALSESSKKLNGFLISVFFVTIVINFFASNSITKATIFLTTFIQQFSLIVHLPFIRDAQIPAIVNEVFKYLLPFVMFDVADLLEKFDENYTLEYLM